MSEKATSGAESPAAAQSTAQPTASEPGFFSQPPVRRTIVRHVATYLLLTVSIGLLVRSTPDLGAFLGLDSFLSGYQDDIPAALSMVGGITQLAVGLFAFLFTLVVAPVVAVIVGAVTAIVERAERKTLTSASGVGGFLAVFLPIGVGFLLLGSQLPMAAISTGEAISSAAVMAVPSALAAAGTTFLCSDW